MRSSLRHSTALRLLFAFVAVTSLLGASCVGGGGIPQRKVGNIRLGAGCQFDTLSAAIAAAAPGDILQVRADRNFTENVTVGKALELRATLSPICVPVPPGPGGARPVIEAAGASPTMTIPATGAVLLVDLVLRGGNGVDGANLVVGADAEVTLAHVDLLEGIAQRGGGAFVQGSLTLDGDSLVARNFATEGGGVFVDAGVLTLGDVVIEENTTETDGGGIYANAATVTDPDEDELTVEVRGNTAQRDGGGIFVSGGSMSIGATRVASNVAEGNGGGVAVGEPPDLLWLGPLEFNTANLGGGLFAEGAVTISGLGDVTGNTAAIGGGAYLAEQAVLETGADFYDNVASNVGGGVALYSGSSWVGSGILVGNRASGAGGGAMLSASTIDWTGGYVDVTGNVAATGGGIHLDCESAAAVLISNGNVSGNTAGSGGGIFAVASRFNVPSCLVQLTAATRLEGNIASGDGGGIAAVGDVQLYLKEFKARGNRAGGNGGAIATLGADTGVPAITVFNRDDGGQDCLHFPFVPGFDEYCVEFSGNEAGGDGGALYLESATGSVVQSGFLANDAVGRGDAIVLGGPAGSANLALGNSVLADHDAASEVVWVADGSRLTAEHVTAADNVGTPLRWSAGSSGALRYSAIADALLVIDAGVALGGTCNSLFATPAATGGTLAGVIDGGLTAASFFTDPVRGRFQVTAGLALLDDLCANGAAFDVDGAPRDASADRGAFEER